MGDDQHRAAARGQVAGQPGDRLDVEVVGRLVEQQQVGMVEQRVRERDPAPLAAGETADRGVEPVGEAAEARRRRAGRRGPPRKIAVAGPLVLGAVADQQRRRRSSPAVELVALVEQRRCAGRRVRVTCRRRAARLPAIRSSSVDLPSPLRPTTPMRSPSAMPSVTSSGSSRAAKPLLDRVEVDEVTGIGTACGRHADRLQGCELMTVTDGNTEVDRARRRGQRARGRSGSAAALRQPAGAERTRRPELVDEHGVEVVLDLRTGVEVALEGPGPLTDEPAVRIEHRSLYPGSAATPTSTWTRSARGARRAKMRLAG